MSSLVNAIYVYIKVYRFDKSIWKSLNTRRDWIERFTPEIKKHVKGQYIYMQLKSINDSHYNMVGV